MSKDSETASTDYLLEPYSGQYAGLWSNPGPAAAATTPAFGKPCIRTPFSRLQLLALIVSLICLALGVVTISPAAGVDWRLQYTSQIVVVGMLLSIMNICLRIVLSAAFLMLEARFGRSRLQNYEAILSGNFVSSHISLVWRVALVILALLPLNLSIAYKQFLGGATSATLRLPYEGAYGIDFPRIGVWSNIQNSVYLLVSSMAAFASATEEGKAGYPSDASFPLAYGYNTLLLTNQSAAILDIPSSSYIAAMQGNLSSGEFLDITAAVDGYVAAYNASTTAAFQANDTLWDMALDSNLAANEWGLTALSLYSNDNAALGLMPVGDNNQTVFGLYYNSINSGTMLTYSNADDPEVETFRQQAHTYSIQRVQCQGHWQLNASTILLVDGACDDIDSTASVANSSSVMYEAHMGLFTVDIVPPLSHVFGYLAVGKNKENAWLNATSAVSVATMHWARGLYMIAGGTKGVSYAPRNEMIVSTRTTLRADALLYLVLAIQPILTAAGFAVVVWLHRVPISYKFGIVSILSGLEPGSLGLVRGAGLSGELSAPVRLDVVTTTATDASSLAGRDAAPSRDNPLGDVHHQVRYRVRRESKEIQDTFLSRGWVYW